MKDNGMNANLRRAILPSALMAMTFFVFGTFDMYFSNQTEFWFSIRDIFLPCLISAVIAVAVLLAIVFLLGRVWSKAVPVLISLIFSIGVALYLQGNFMVMDYGVLDGKAIQWGNYTAYGIINTIIWGICIIVPLILLRLKTKWFDLTVKYIPMFIIAIQIITLGVLFLTNDISKEERTVFTTENEFELSQDKNVIVFVLDTFDAQYMDDMLKEFPEVKTIFKDFIYFNDACSAYPTTMGSLPFILSGIPYTNEIPFKDYLENVFSEGSILQEARKMGYETDVYTIGDFAATEAVGKVSNAEMTEVSIDGISAFCRKYFQLVAFRYMPHYAKKLFWVYTSEFADFMKASNRTDIYNWDDTDFKENLENAVTANRDEPVLKIYHLEGTHPPLKLDENLESVSADDTSGSRQARGCFKVIESYINQLKEMNLYENSSVVIMADHGIVSFQCPTLLIKRANIEQPELRINSAPVSYLADWKATILSLLNEDGQADAGVFSVEEDEQRVRTYYRYTWGDRWDAEFLPDIYEYQFSCKARDMDYEKDFTGKVYAGTKTAGEYHYQIGDVCEIGDVDFEQYGIKYGMIGDASSKGHQAWLEKDTKIEMVLSELPKSNLLLHLEIQEVNGCEQRLESVVNGVSVGECVVTQGETYKDILIPRELVENKKLTIEFCSPNAVPLYSSYGPMPISIEITSMRLTETNEQEITINPKDEYPTINKMTVLDLKKEVNFNDRITIRGVYPFDGYSTWTTEKVDFIFCTDMEEDFAFTLSYGTFYKELQGIVYFNGIKIGDLPKVYASETFVLPKEYLNPEQPQVVEIFFPEATSPKLYGNGADEKEERVFGISIYSIAIGPHQLRDMDNADTTVNLKEGDPVPENLFIQGIYPQEGDHVWMSDTMQLQFRASGEKDIEWHMEYGTYYEQFDAVITLNGTEIGRLTEPNTTAAVVLPKELILPGEVQTLTVTVPGATSPKLYGHGANSEDERVLGLCIYSMEFIIE